MCIAKWVQMSKHINKKTDVWSPEKEEIITGEKRVYPSILIKEINS